MALTKVTLTGTVDALKQGWTKFNDLIDDLLATTAGLGASQIGIEDSAGNMDADNVEDALAEVYTDVTGARNFTDTLDENSATTTGLVWGYKGGLVRFDNTVTTIAASTITLTDDTTNYVQVNTSGTVIKNTTGFTAGNIPVRQVVCSGGVQSSSTDKRSYLNGTFTDATATVAGVVELATNAEGLLGQDTSRAPTPSVVRNILYNLGGDSRAQFTHVNDTDITIEPASYRHNGTVDQIVYWTSQLTYTFSSLGTSDWSYLYLDDSAIVTADTNVISASELTDSITEPAWSAAKRGWYNGEDRCIFAVFTDGSDDIIGFYHDGDLVLYDYQLTVTSGDDVDIAWADITAALTMPSFARRARIFALFNNIVTDGIQAKWRTNGDAGSGHELCHAGTAASLADGGNSTDVITDSGQLIELSSSADGNDQLSVYINGWYFPIGM